MSVTTRPSRRADPDVPASPAATRRRRAVWRDPRLVVGVAMVAVSALLGVTLAGTGEGGASVWAARSAMASGQALSAEDLVRRQVAFADQADADRYLSAEEPVPEGAALARGVGAGELVPRAALTAAAEEQILEVPLSVQAEAVPVTLRVGSLVDVWVTSDPSGALQPGDEALGDSLLVFQDVRVLALSRARGALAAGGPRQVVVGVAPEQEGAFPTVLGRLATGTVTLVRTG